MTYHCDDELSFDVVSEEKGGRAVVKMGGRAVALPGGRFASGAKYSDGRITLRGKEQEAFIEIDGRIVYRNCRAAAAD